MDNDEKVNKLRDVLNKITIAFGDYASFQDKEDYEELVKAMNEGLSVLEETR